MEEGERRGDGSPTATAPGEMMARDDVGEALARRMWTLFEAVHAVVYFAQEALDAFEQAGLRGFWRGYFAQRAAPLGEVGPAPITAAFFSFAPSMVARALPDVWSRITPEDALRTRLEGSVAALEGLLQRHDRDTVAEVADLLEHATDTLDCSGRVLGAANAALDRPDQPLARLWHATTILREHRGDGHVSALVVSGVDGCEALVWRASLHLDRERLQRFRGWSDDAWEAALRRLRDRGWVDGEGRATEEGGRRHREMEAATDWLAAAPWLALGRELAERLIRVLTPIAAACSEALRYPNPIGVPRPDSSG